MIRVKLTIFILLSFLNITAQQSEIQYLSGTDAEHTSTWQFYCSEGNNSKKWSTIEVPSCWEQQGYGSYNYGHVKFEDRIKETGLYKKTFSVPLAWKNKQVDIVFEGVMTDATVKINGKLAGPTHQGAFYEFSYDVSKLLNYGKDNHIEVLVKKHSENMSVNHAERKSDYWVFGGIFRPVYLSAKPKEHIKNVAINATANGDFFSNINTSSLKKNTTLLVEINTLDGKLVKKLNINTKGQTHSIQGKIDEVETWTSETPNLYTATYKIIYKGATVHQYQEKFGFRTIEIRANDGIYVNNTRIKFKGVNRHTFHPKYGRTSSKKLSIEAVNLMKDMNMNAVRMSHYPPEKHFLDVCDSLGLYVLDELAGWQRPSYDDEIASKLVKEMIKKDVNHPSILIWDNGNENGWNYTIDHEFTELDIQKREVIHPREDFNKTNTMHYIRYKNLSHDGFSKRKIFFPTEFLHGLYDGGHGAGLEDFWFRLWHNPLSAGGFLWVFADEGIERTDKNNEIDLHGNAAADGILSPYMQKEASFYTIKHLWSPVHFEKRYVTPEFNGSFNIENRYHYTNLNTCTFNVSWINYDNPDGTTEPKIYSKETLKVSLKPQNNGQLQIALPKGWEETDVLKVVVLNKEGNAINTWTWPVKTPEQKISEIKKTTLEKSPRLIETEHNYVVESGTISYSFSKKNGLLNTVTRNGVLIPLSKGPIFVNYDKEIESVKTQIMDNGSITINALFANSKTSWNKTSDYFTWIIRNDGLLELKTAFAPKDDSESVGFGFSLPKNNVNGLKWMGQGPQRVWKNRMTGPQFGVWEKQYNNAMTGTPKVEYPEFKGFHAETYWAVIKGENMPDFKVYIKTNDVFLKILNPEEAKGSKYTAVDFPEQELGFLHGINAIGTKFHSAAALGPQGSAYRFESKNYKEDKLKLDLVFDFTKNEP